MGLERSAHKPDAAVLATVRSAPCETVVVVRNPLEVVTSLHRRNGFSTALGLTLWQIYAERVLEDTSPDERLVTHFDSYFLEPDREITRMLDFLGLDRDQDLPGT